MKHMKKMFSLLLTLIMVSAMALSVSAATITVEGGAAGSQYSAYKLLDAKNIGENKFSYTVNTQLLCRVHPGKQPILKLLSTLAD